MSGKMWLRQMRDVFGVHAPEQIAQYCRENWKEEVEHALKTADEACENTFVFDFPWDMERTSKPIHFENKIDWYVIPDGDPEFLWQFNRHRFLLCLGQAYQMTKDEKYAENYVRLMEDWMDHVLWEEEGIDQGPWRTLETGLRAESWLCSLPLILESKAVGEEFLEKVERCLRQHQIRLMENFQIHKYISNWGVLESYGLLLLSVVLPDSEACLDEAVRRLRETAKVQVLADGMQWEQSPMYHNEVYHCYLTAYYYGQRAAVDMPEEISNVVRQMAYVDYKWKKPDHKQFAQGDSDAADLREKITMGAYVLKDGMLKSGGYDILDYDSAWRFGIEGCREYAEIQKIEPDFLSVELPFGGNYYFRSGWSEQDHLLHFHCGETGGGHGHADKMHVDLVIRGEDVLVDAGRYTYVDGEVRAQFKNALAHNTVVVDGEEFSPCETSWIYKKLCTCLKQQFYVGKLGSFVEGTHMGYWDQGILVNRKIIWIHPALYLLVDCFYAKGQHVYESYLHFDSKGEASLYQMENGRPGIRFIGKNMETYLQFLAEDSEHYLEQSEQSDYYNEKHQNQMYRGKRVGTDFVRNITIINGGERGKIDPVRAELIPLYSKERAGNVSSEEAEGLRIFCGEKEYVLFLCHREIMTPTDILKWENCVGHGKVVLFDRTEEKKELITGEILAW